MDIREFSKRLGVSTTTISHALNGKRPVKAATRQLILEKMEEWNYTPNINARRLVNNRTNMIAFFSEVTETLADPYQLEILRILCRQLRMRNYDLLLDLCHEAEDIPFASLRNRVQAHAVDGSIIIGAGLDAETLGSLATKDCPCVYIDSLRHESIPHTVGISVDTQQAYREALLCLRQIGRKRPAVLARIEADSQLKQWRRQLAETGFELLPEHCVFSEESIQSGRDTALSLLLRTPRPDVILTRTDSQAQGVLRAAQQLKIKVPEELSIISFGDVDYALESTPPLSMVSFDYRKLGECAVKVLFELLSAPDRQLEPITFSARFLARGSLI